jgi:hypothetical protein
MGRSLLKSEADAAHHSRLSIKPTTGIMAAGRHARIVLLAAYPAVAGEA